jgi:hypothetical protein
VHPLESARVCCISATYLQLDGTKSRSRDLIVRFREIESRSMRVHARPGGAERSPERLLEHLRLEIPESHIQSRNAGIELSRWQQIDQALVRTEYAARIFVNEQPAGVSGLRAQISG